MTNKNTKNNFWKGLAIGLSIPLIIIGSIIVFFANYFGFIGTGKIASFNCGQNMNLYIKKEKRSSGFYNMYDYYSLILQKDNVEKLSQMNII